MARSRKGPGRSRPPAKRKAPAKAKKAPAKAKKAPARKAPVKTKRQKAAHRQDYLRRAQRLGYAIAKFKEPPREVIPLGKIPPIDLDDVEAFHVGPMSVHQTLTEATAALNRVRDGEQASAMRQGAFTSGLSIGLSIVAVLGLGLVLVYILFRKKDDGAGPTIIQAPAPPAPPPQIIQLRDNRSRVIDVRDKEPDLPEYLGDEEPILERTNANPIENIAAAIVSALKKDRNSDEMRTFMQSFSLPYIGDPTSEAIRVVTAGDTPFEVIVRCVEPPGGHAILAFDPVELNISGGLPFVSTVGTAYSEFPVGNVLPIPAGQFQIIRLRPRQALYAKGTVRAGGANQSTAVAGVILAVTAADFVSGISW